MKNRIKKESEFDNIRRELIRSAIMTFCALFVLVFVSLAWFASNTKVSGGGSSVSSNDSYFELQSGGKKGVHDDFLAKIITVFSPDDSQKVSTSSANAVVNWLVNGDSNMENYSADTINWESADREDYAISPGSFGTLKFSVISKIDGKLSLSFDLKLVPYDMTEDKSGVKEIQDTEDEQFADLLQGHFLFFLKDGTDNYTWIEDGAFSLIIENAEKNGVYDFEVFWCWPQTFADYILNTADPYLGSNSVLENVYENNSSIRTAVISSVKTKPQLYLFNSDGDTVFENSGDNIESILTAIGTGNIGDVENKTDVIQKLLNLNSAYNQADQSIGKNISFLRVSLSAKMNLGA